MHFATCDTTRAVNFINYYHPKITKDKIPKLLKLIEEDKLRVLDPMMHAKCEIILGPKYQDVDSDEVQEAVTEITTATLESKEIE